MSDFNPRCIDLSTVVGAMVLVAEIVIAFRLIIL